MRTLLASTVLALLCALLPAADASGTPTRNTVLKQFPSQANQGVAVDEKHFYAISHTAILKCDKETGEQVARWAADKKVEAYKHFTHMNSGTVIDGKLYCAHSRFPVDKNDNTVEIWDVRERRLEHVKTIRLPRDHGSLTWADRRHDGSWWLCYAVYGKDANKATTLARCTFDNEKFSEVKTWTFPEEVIRTWGSMSCSGGSWGPDGCLYTTGHGSPRASVLKLTTADELKYVRTEKGVGFSGQAIAWDRSVDKPILWGIVSGKSVSATLIPEKNQTKR